MNSIRIIACAILVTLLSATMVHADNVEKPQGIFKDQIIRLISDPTDGLFQQNEEEMAVIEFIINLDSEVVLLNVDTDNRNVKEYIEKRMAYKKVAEETYHQDVVYELKVNFINKWAVTFKYEEPRA
jgi:hypothetical protein